MTKKQGEVGEITKKSVDEKDKAFKASGIEGTKIVETKDAEKDKKSQDVVTGEDVLKILRAKGKNI